MGQLRFVAVGQDDPLAAPLYGDFDGIPPLLIQVGDDETLLDDSTRLAEAAGSVGTPQIRNAGTLAGNLTQRPWCWYFRQGFPCYKHGGTRCFSRTGENQFNAILGGGPSFIVHPSDTAPALVALDAQIHVVGDTGNRWLPIRDFLIEGDERDGV